MDIDGVLTFERVPGGTSRRWAWDGRPHGALRLLGPFVTWMGRRQGQRIWYDLKRCVDGAQDMPGSA
jgi:hypothetical protein